jgi:alpha-mannosidase
VKVFVVSHTHWDREWYHPAERFRQRLVPLIDELLDASSEGQRFLLDGQTVVLEDYLDVRPERAAELGAALRDQRLEAGPWFVLADELIPGAEGLVRNLLAGRRTLRSLRAEAPPVLYCPDSFGHPAMLPLLARGFDKGVIVLWRGFGGAGAPARDCVWWETASAERALLYHLSPSGYELGANLPVERAAAVERWDRIRSELMDRSATGVVLLLNGADHHARQADLPSALDALRAAAAPDETSAGTLASFASALSERAATVELSQVSGELRDSYGYTWTLQGTLASRAHLKRWYAMAEREMLRDVEPWAALASFDDRGSLRALVNAAWRSILLCQPHDTLCGCSIDEVAKAMAGRLDSASTQAAGLRQTAVFALLGHDAQLARQAPDDWRAHLVVRNRAARARSGIALVELTLKVADIPVGPGSRHVPLARALRDMLPPAIWPVGEPVQILDIALANERTEAPRSYPDNDAVVRFSAAAWIDAVPGLGIRALPFPAHEPAAADVPGAVSVKGRSLSNDRLTLRWDASGRLSLEDHIERRTITSLLDWECRRDVGDLYTPSIRQRKAVPRFLGTRVVHRGPLRGVVEQHWRFAARSERVDVRIRFALDAGASFLRMQIEGDNAAQDHRLRVRVRSDVREGITIADAAFGPVEREALAVSEADARMERPIASAPLHRYVTRFDAQRGSTVFSDGLAEYEIVKDGVAITLLRAVGELSRSNLPERPGHAGWPASTPEAQCPGAFAAELALMLHGPRTPTVIDAIERAADDVLLPLVGETLRSALRTPPAVQGASLDGVGLTLSCVKESEDGGWLVLRAVNLLEVEVAGTWRLGRMITAAHLARLDETPVSPLEVRGDRIPFLAPARAVVTILAR